MSTVTLPNIFSCNSLEFCKMMIVYPVMISLSEDGYVCRYVAVAESWTIKKAEHECLWTVVLEKTLVSPLDCKEIQPVHPKGSPPWIFIGRTDAEAGAPILWPPDAKSWLIRKDPDAGKGWGQEEKRATEDEMAGWHHQFNGHEFGQTPGDGERQRPGVLQSMGSQRVRHKLATEQQQLFSLWLHLRLCFVWAYVWLCVWVKGFFLKFMIWGPKAGDIAGSKRKSK